MLSSLKLGGAKRGCKIRVCQSDIRVEKELNFHGDFKSGVAAPMNHPGDNDSTGAITGAILGVLLGNEAIPDDWIDRLENSREIEDIACEMHRIFKEKPSEWLYEKD